MSKFSRSSHMEFLSEGRSLGLRAVDHFLEVNDHESITVYNY